MFRGENEKVLTLALRPPEDRGLAILQRFHVKAQNEAGLLVPWPWKTRIKGCWLLLWKTNCAMR
jgi:hypothetical protein